MRQKAFTSLHRLKAIALAMAFMAAFSCTEAPLTEKETLRTLAQGSFSFSLTGVLPELTEEKDSLAGRAATQYTVRINWSKGDRLSVVNLTTGRLLGGHLAADAAGFSTTFSGTLQGTVNEGDRLAFLYPANESREEETAFDRFSVDFSQQPGTQGKVPLAVFSTLVADRTSFEKASLSFSYLMCYIMAGLSDIPASSPIETVTISGVTQSFDLAINGAKTGFDITPHPGEILLTLNQKASAAGVKTVYVAIPASAAVTRTIELNTGATCFSTLFTSAALQNGKAYNTNVSGFLVDDFIPKDESMRAYCLEHFDANKDGRLTLVEIAGVTAFPDPATAPLPDGITSFDELEFFYSLKELPSFEGQSSLERITIPRQVTAIPDRMFAGCSTLVKVTLLPEHPPVLGEEVFPGMEDRLQLIVSDSAVADYQAAEGWKDFFNNFRTPSGEDDTAVGIDTEDEHSMQDETIDIEIK